MYWNISVRIDGERSQELEVKVGVHHGSVLSPLLFAVVVREGGVKELLYAYTGNLVLLGDGWK